RVGERAQGGLGMFRSKSESGFTLIELVIVIVILGILAAVAIPKYEDMREQARVATIKGQLGSIRSAIAIQYARNALNGSAVFPVLDGTIFADGRVPKEPVNNVNTVKTTPGVDDTGGWQYTAATGIVKINVSTYSSY
ncbi:MAG TPA: prepilin-type N-terminal cleavage/methylation domain-containing protein, partial [Candidatus Eisenbacteria bacterium]|nr:prepilin-type N-terminal cleavage/methylation domain-containing protein [Candidatus Eisenbacteria bacterium]